MGRNYLLSREEGLHQQVVDYCKLQYPSVLFRTDLGGVRLPMGLAAKVKRLQAGRAWPDFFIAEAWQKYDTDEELVAQYHGMFLELKKEGTVIYKKDGTIRASDNSRFQEQYDMMILLRSKGYYANFAIGFTDAKKQIDAYLTGDPGSLI